MFIGVCCCNAATKRSMVWIVMPTFYCNYFWGLELGGPLHSGAPWTLPTPLLRHCVVSIISIPLRMCTRRISSGTLRVRRWYVRPSSTTIRQCVRGTVVRFPSQWRSDGGAGRTGRHLLGAAKGRKRRKLKKNSRENSYCKFHICLRARKTKRYGHRVLIVSYYDFKQGLQFQQESPANAKGTRDSSASMKAHCEQM